MVLNNISWFKTGSKIRLFRLFPQRFVLNLRFKNLNFMKKVIHSLFIFTVVISLAACQPEDETTSYLNDTKWIATHFTLSMPSHKNSDSTYTIKANPSNWTTVLNGQPSQFQFKSDGSYVEAHFSMDGAPVVTYQGKWTISNDSLILNMEKPAFMQQLYTLNLDAEKAVLHLLRTDDLDNDKVKDDQQVVQYKKQ